MRGGYAKLSGSDTDSMVHTVDQFSVLKKLLPMLWPTSVWNRIQIVIALILLIASNLINLLVPLAMKYAVDDLTSKKVPTTAIVMYGTFRFMGEFTLEMRNLIYAQISATLEKNVASDLFSHLQKLSLRFHLDRKTGAVLRSVSRGASSFASAGQIILFQFFPIILQVLIVSGYLFARYSWPYGVTTLITIVVYLIFTFVTTEWRTKFRKIANDKDNEYNQRAVDALLNFETVKYFCAEKHEQTRYEIALQEYRDAYVVVMQTLSFLNLGQNLIVSAGVVVVMIVAGSQCVDGLISIGDFILVGQFILTLYSPLESLGSYYRALSQYLIDIETMFRLFNEEIEIKDDPEAVDFRPMQGEIVFDNVSFGYDANYPLLQNISFRIKPGQRVAIVGPSGAGKSTIARLLYRFYEPHSGIITIDGQRIDKLTQFSLRSRIAIVPQDTVLFNDTIGYNIGYGAVASGQTATIEQIDEAAEAASLSKFIGSKKERYDIKVGERGLRLSGGEKQRVGIARALLKAPLIFVFDEATSALDTLTERDIQQSIEHVSQGYTSITIAHRLSTIMDSDVIFVLKKGEIVEKGTHSELLAINCEYAAMWRRQEEAQSINDQITRLQGKAEEMKRKENRAASIKSDTLLIDIDQHSAAVLNGNSKSKATIPSSFDVVDANSTTKFNG